MVNVLFAEKVLKSTDLPVCKSVLEDWFVCDNDRERERNRVNLQ